MAVAAVIHLQGCTSKEWQTEAFLLGYLLLILGIHAYHHIVVVFLLAGHDTYGTRGTHVYDAFRLTSGIDYQFVGMLCLEWCVLGNIWITE